MSPWKTIAISAAMALAFSLTSAADQDAVDSMPPGEPAGSSSSGFVHILGGSYLGIDSRDVTADRVAALKLKEERGAEVMMVDQDAPAGKAGIQEHDVILQFNAQPVESVEQLGRMIHETPPGRTVALLISRDGQPVTISVKLADRTQAMATSKLLRKEFSFKAMPPMPAMPQIPEMPDFDIQTYEISTFGAHSGLLVENLTPQLGEFFGVKNGEGVLVRSVEKNSSGETAGFRAGDVITRVESEKVTNRGDWKMALRGHRSGKVNVTVVRDKREQVLTLTLPERKANPDSSQLEENDFDFEMPDMHSYLLDIRKAVNEAKLQQISSQAMKKAAAALRQQAEELRRALNEVQ
jgi:membrane-associated protease RseP (regulator of RpoE activity)